MVPLLPYIVTSVVGWWVYRNRYQLFLYGSYVYTQTKKYIDSHRPICLLRSMDVLTDRESNTSFLPIEYQYENTRYVLWIPLEQGVSFLTDLNGLTKVLCLPELAELRKRPFVINRPDQYISAVLHISGNNSRHTIDILDWIVPILGPGGDFYKYTKTIQPLPFTTLVSLLQALHPIEWEKQVYQHGITSENYQIDSIELMDCFGEVKTLFSEGHNLLNT